MYINAVAGSVMLYLQHDFCNIIFKVENKLYTALWPAPPPPPKEEFWVRACSVTTISESKSMAKKKKNTVAIVRERDQRPIGA
jgi:hypothetical protein